MTEEHQHELLLAFIGPVFVFRGLLWLVSGLVFAVCRPPSSVLIFTNTDTNSERRDGGVLLQTSKKERLSREYENTWSKSPETPEGVDGALWEGPG